MNSWMLPNLSKKQKIGFLSSFSCWCSMSWNMEKSIILVLNNPPFFHSKNGIFDSSQEGQGAIVFYSQFWNGKTCVLNYNENVKKYVFLGDWVSLKSTFFKNPHFRFHSEPSTIFFYQNMLILASDAINVIVL